MRKKLIYMLQITALGLFSFALEGVAQLSITGVGLLSGDTSSFGRGISADGVTAVGRSQNSTDSSPYRWTQSGGIVTLGNLPGGTSTTQNDALDASTNGAVIVGKSRSSNGTEAFRWTQSGGMVGLGSLNGAFNFLSVAEGVSNDGTVVAGRTTSSAFSGNSQAFRWTQSGGMVGIGDLPGGFSSSSAWGISGDGLTIVGDSGSTNGTEAFRWTQSGGMIGIGDLSGGSFNSRALDASTDGSVIVGYGSNATTREPFRWTQSGGMVGLGNLPGSGFGQANGVSADGGIVVGASSSRAFIWTDFSGTQNLKDYLVARGLDLTNWTLLDVQGISSDGTIVTGTAIDPTSSIVGYVAVIPEPSTYAFILSLAALLWIFWVRRRAE